METLLAFVVGAALGECAGDARRGAQQGTAGQRVRARTRESGERAALAHPPVRLSPFRSCARGAGGAVEVRVGQSRRGPGWHSFAAAGAQPGARKRGVSCSGNPAGCNVTPTAAGGAGEGGAR